MYFNQYTQRIENHLSEVILPKSEENLLQSAMRYSVLNGGKRFRPLLVYTIGIALGAKLELLDAPAAAVELIHCYSLIHDDLPAMDNDDLRRGKPTCHKVYGEATAILAGDALQTLAFEILADAKLNPIAPELQIKMIQTLAKASGAYGMVGGQALDMAATNSKEKNKTATQTITIDQLNTIHKNKTGALIEAAILLGAIAANYHDPQKLVSLKQIGENLGLLFQIQDDILDVTSESNTLGKTAGKDLIQNKATFPSILGLERAQQKLKDLFDNTIELIQNNLPNPKSFLELAYLNFQRVN